MLVQIIIIIFDILLIFFGVFIISRYQTWFAKHRLKILSAFIILGICIYTIGYLTKSQGPLDYISSGLMAIFSTGRMFVLENDISSFETNVTNMPLYNIFFGLIMTFSLLVTGMIILSLLGYRVMSKIQLKFIRCFTRNKKVYIFTALNKNSLALANDIKKQNKDSIIILSVDNKSDSDESIRLEIEASKYGHIIYMIYSLDDIINICLRFVKYKTFIFAINEDIYDNITFTDQYAESYKKNKKKNKDVSLYVFTDHNICEDVFSRDDFSQLDIHIIDLNNLISRQLFDQFTLVSTLDKKEVLTVCIIGFSEICEDLYRNIIILGQCDGIKLKLVLVEQEIRDKTASFFQKNPEVEKCASFEFVDAKLDTEQYYIKLKGYLPDLNCIIIANDDVETASEVSRLCIHSKAKARICAYVKDYEKYKVLFKTTLLSNVIWFGSSNNLFTENNIINEELDHLAKQCHDFYNSVYKSTRTWEEISLFEKQSNRALALHFQSKLNSVGLSYEKGSKTTIYENLLKDNVIFDQLSKGEHMRWNAYHFVNGWRTMTDIQGKEKNKDEVLKLHSCLVEWDELDHVSSVFNKDYKKADQFLIQNLGLILSSSGYGITKSDL